ncbi:hypothetical protein RND71_015780 [Anisodus tanguticus]|uniref:Uncharacterized protein n=1 Tax=Anisodus tanguticus TaxID=243964 RepID=A0AAE1S766_9SOLA|nr:hypothetical protein RND71_015780 [Anisodus tanguticus]
MDTLLRGGMDHLASAINCLSTLPPIPESKIWQMVNEMDLKQTVITQAYLYIFRHADFCRMLIGVPWEARKSLLLSAMIDEIEHEYMIMYITLQSLDEKTLIDVVKLEYQHEALKFLEKEVVYALHTSIKGRKVGMHLVYNSTVTLQHVFARH